MAGWENGRILEKYSRNGALVNRPAYSARMTAAEVAVTNVLYRYAEMIDAGRFEDMADDLFRHAKFVIAPPPADPLDGNAMARLLVATTMRHEDGTPRTKHVITNPIVEVDEEAGTARCRSYYTVLQRTETLPLHGVQPCVPPRGGRPGHQHPSRNALRAAPGRLDLS